jgi:H+/Cl- antiporter ClcA
LHGFSYLRKWLILSVGIGAVAGVGAIAFVHAIRICEWLFLEVLGGYTPPSAIGEGAGPGTGFARPWAVPLVTTVGGLLAGIVVHRFAPEAEGHGTDAAILAVHHDPRGVRGRVAAVKIVASAITIGSGGSAGREGPTAQISSGFASSLARALDLTPADARIAVTVGIGAGIGAIFRAPLGGAVLGAEILYRDDIEAEALFPSFIASITGFAVFGAVEGFTPIFGYLEPGHFTNPLQLLFYAAIGVVAGAVGVIYARSFYGVEAFAKRLAMPAWAKPALAGALVGLIGLAVPGALGTGYGWLQRAAGARCTTPAVDRGWRYPAYTGRSVYPSRSPAGTRSVCGQGSRDQPRTHRRRPAG